ncbi:MAG: CDGSH iron-sulfur domain-containing protein [Culicoidibacterales bacterium]
MSKPSISVTKNAPYAVRGAKEIHTDHVALPLNETAFLCRCGQSQNKPYCDGSHARSHFNSTQQKPCSAKNHTYTGNGITVFYNPSLCGHIAACVQGLPEVFNPENSPWIDPKAADVESIIATIKKCPSGALTYQLDGEAIVSEWFSDSSISAITDGPYSITQMKLIPEAESVSCLASDDHYILCRCGQSKRKPLCDGSHHHIHDTPTDSQTTE